MWHIRSWQAFLRHDGTVGTDGRREGRGWHRAGRRASRRSSGRAGPGTRGGPSSPARRAPWCPGPRLLALVEPPGTGAGRQPWPAETLPGTRLARCRLNLSDVACEDACHGSLSVRDLVGCRYRVPDATTLEDFRHLPGENDVGRALLDVVVARLEAAGLVMRGGSVAGATTMEAPSSTKNASGSRDPEMHQTKKGNQWHFGTRCHSGEDAGSGHARGATLAAAGVPDVCEAHGLVRDDDGLCYADAGWRGVARREEVRSDPHPSGCVLSSCFEQMGLRWAPPGPGPHGGPGGWARGAEPRPPCARGQAPLPDRQAHLRLREGPLPRHREEREPHPHPARQRQPAHVRQGREAGGVPGGLRGGRLTAAEGTGVPRGRPEGPREGPGTPETGAGVRM